MGAIRKSNAAATQSPSKSPVYTPKRREKGAARQQEQQQPEADLLDVFRETSGIQAGGAVFSNAIARNVSKFVGKRAGAENVNPQTLSQEQLEALEEAITRSIANLQTIDFDWIIEKYGTNGTVDRVFRGFSAEDLARFAILERRNRFNNGIEPGVFVYVADFLVPAQFMNNHVDVPTFKYPQKRTPWTDLELAALEDGMKACGTNWAGILKLHGEMGSRTQHLAGRGQVALKDKARNERRRRERNGIDVGVFQLAGTVAPPPNPNLAANMYEGMPAMQ